MSSSTNVNEGTQRERFLLQKAKDAKKEARELRKELDDLEARAAFVTELQAKGAGSDVGIITDSTDKGRRHGVAVALLSDVHAGELVKPSKVHHLNAYDLEVCRQRISRFFRTTAWLVKNHQRAFHIDDLILGVLGDVITGYLRAEDLETCEIPPLKACRFIQSLLRTGIEYLLSELDVERVHVLCVHGNHGRVTEKPRIKTSADNSFEHWMYLTLADMFDNDDRVQFVVSDANEIVFPVYQWNTRWMHGDEVRYNSGIGGVMVPLNRTLHRLNKAIPCLVTFLGHHHSLKLDKDAVINGSVVGYNEYALKKGYEYEVPQQAFCIIDSIGGVCMLTPIWLGRDRSKVVRG